MLRACHARYGGTFRLRIAHEGTWVFLTRPEDVKNVFTGDPRLLHAGEANRILLPIVGPHSLLLLDEAQHMEHRRLLPLRPARDSDEPVYRRAITETPRRDAEVLVA